MAIEQTLSIIKPNAINKNVIGKIIDRLETGGLTVIAAKMVHLTKTRAESFYEIHRGKPFFNGLVSFMSSGTVLVMALSGEKAISKNREIMGATNPANAAPHTIRADFADSIDENAVHGSDAPDTAQQEIAFFFNRNEIFIR